MNRKLTSLLYYATRRICTTPTTSAPFGIVLDIDGVLFRGRDVIPKVPDAFRLLTDEKGNFKVPTLFLTNGSNSLRAAKAQRLSQHLGLEIRSQQVVMAHSPLRMFKKYHDKHVLVVGQGPIAQIANNLGFTNVTTLDQLRQMFPHLDCVDFSRRKFDELNYHPPANFQPIEAIILLGEPLFWESALQLIIDVLITGGDPGGITFRRGAQVWPNLPLFACNVDMVWMAEKGVHLPRIGHGTFLTCIEATYEKFMGQELKYEAVLGKPSEFSYIHAAHILQDMAIEMKQEPPRTIYVIGDNPLSDILGSNLYNRFLKHGGKGRTLHAKNHERLKPLKSSHTFTNMDLEDLEKLDEDVVQSEEETKKGEGELKRAKVEESVSVLVETGVYREGCRINGIIFPINKLIHEMSTAEQEQLKVPDFVEKDLYSAVKMVLNREKYRG